MSFKIKKRVVIILTICTFGGGCSFLYGYICGTWGVPNRYGSMVTHNNDLYYFANHRIYQYTFENQKSSVFSDNVYPFFDYYNGSLYYISGREVICAELDNGNKRTIIYEPKLKRFDWESIDIVNDKLVVSYDIPRLNEDEVVSDEIELHDNIANQESTQMVKKNNEDIDKCKIFVDGGVTGSAIANNDIFYARHPYGESYVSSYQIVRDRGGKIIGVNGLEDVLPYSDINGFNWNSQTISFLCIFPIIFIIVGSIISLRLFSHSKTRK